MRSSSTGPSPENRGPHREVVWISAVYWPSVNPVNGWISCLLSTSAAAEKKDKKADSRLDGLTGAQRPPSLLINKAPAAFYLSVPQTALCLLKPWRGRVLFLNMHQIHPVPSLPGLYKRSIAPCDLSSAPIYIPLHLAGSTYINPWDETPADKSKQKVSLVCWIPFYGAKHNSSSPASMQIIPTQSKLRRSYDGTKLDSLFGFWLPWWWGWRGFAVEKWNAKTKRQRGRG